uniref:Uncharacterized protein n=1 Tax=Cucumis melo TaxID=3656 RepID=A0A9I9E292_CUCME
MKFWINHLIMNHPMMHCLKLWVLKNMAVEYVPRKSNKVDTTQQIIDENEALRKHI